MIDRLEDIVPGESAVGTKNVTINEQFFQGHFPAQAVMPGVLIIEAMAQTAAALVMYTLGDEAHGKVVYFMSVDEARFRKPVVPGDTLKIHVARVRNRRSVWKFSGEARVEGTLVANATFRSEEHTSELRSLMRISYAVFCLKKKKENHTTQNNLTTSLRE